VGAALASVTAPCELLPPTTDDGLSAIVDTAGAGGGDDGVTVNDADRVTPPPDTEIATTVFAVTADVNTLKPPVVEPAGIVTAVGTEAIAGLLLMTCSVRSDD
jgi:hypothetical protein